MNSEYVWNIICKYLGHCYENEIKVDEKLLDKMFSNTFKAMNTLYNFNIDLAKRIIITYGKIILRNQWDENRITEYMINDILDSYEELGFKEAKINVFKLNKKLNAESTFGDIAFIVRNIVDNENIIEGVGFIEAKRDYQDDNNHTYKKFNEKQAKNIRNHTTSSFYCFYSRNSFFPTISTSFLVEHIGALNIKWSDYSDKYIYSSVAPISIMEQIQRFQNGYDLDRSDLALSIAKGYEEKIGLPQYIVDLQSFDKNNEMQLFLSNKSLDINNDLYVELTKDTNSEKINDIVSDKPCGPRMG